jgi:hypothetical protein
MEFKNCLLAGDWKILAVDETFRSISSSKSANTIVLYASMEGQLILQVYKLSRGEFQRRRGILRQRKLLPADDKGSG